MWVGVLVRTCNPSFRRWRLGGCGFEPSPGKKLVRPDFNKKGGHGRVYP
jgi:hypothetical protein